MTDDSPVSILFDANGNVIAVANAAVLPGTQSAILLAGRDGATGRHIIVDAFGRPIIVGAGTAGTPVGGVLTVQGIVGGTPLEVTGTITDTDPATGATGVVVPAFASQNGHPDAAGLLRAVRAHDLDIGAGTEFNVGVNLRLSALGGSVEAGTAVNPLRVDPTGTTTQPISAVSLPLPTGAATEVTLASVLAQLDVALSTRASQATVAAILAQLDVALSTRASEATLTTRASEATVASILAQLDVALSTRASQVTVASILAQLDVALSTRASEATVATLLTEAAFQARINTLGQKTMANSTPVVIASDQSDIGVKQATASNLNAQVIGNVANGAAVSGNPVQVAGENAAGDVQRLRTAILPPVDSTPGVVVRQVVSQTGTTTSVAASVASVTLLAANTSRLDAVITNDGNKILYVKLGATASTTSYTYKLLAGERTPPLAAQYTGVIDGAWSSAAGGAGSAVISEMT